MAVAEAKICTKEQKEAAEATASDRLDCEVRRIHGEEGGRHARGEDAMARTKRPPMDGGGRAASAAKLVPVRLYPTFA